MQDQIGPMFLGFLGLVLGSYGVRELALACRVGPLDEWAVKGWLGIGGVMLGALFADYGCRLPIPA